MDTLRTILSRIASLFRARQLDRDLDDELRAHIDLAIEEKLKQGISRKEARHSAYREFGGFTQDSESYRTQRGLPWLEQATRNTRYALRQLRKSPGFALTAILTLALGIGAATSVFSVVNAVLLKPFAFRDPDRLVVMREAVEDEGRAEWSATPDNYRPFMRLKNGSKTIADAAIFQQKAVNVSVTGDHPRIEGAIVASPNLFHLLGVQPILGRGFMDSDARKGADNV